MSNHHYIVMLNEKPDMYSRHKRKIKLGKSNTHKHTCLRIKQYKQTSPECYLKKEWRHRKNLETDMLVTIKYFGGAPAEEVGNAGQEVFYIEDECLDDFINHYDNVFDTVIYADGMLLIDDEKLEETEKRQPNQNLRISFYNGLLKKFKDIDSPLFKRMSNCMVRERGLWKGDIGYYITSLGETTRIEFYLESSDRSKNKQVFSLLEKYKSKIETDFGSLLHWEGSETKRIQKVFITLAGGYESKNWDDIYCSIINNVNSLHSSLYKYIKDYLPWERK